MINIDTKICVIVVTYNRVFRLQECLSALQSQTRPPDEIIIIDNASLDNTEQVIKTMFSEFTYIRLEENIGGAGGFHEGMKIGYEKGYDWLWIMDDDAVPAAVCLEELLKQSTSAAVLKPIQIDSVGRKYGQGNWKGRFVPVLDETQNIFKIEIFSFVGPLIHRNVVEKVGYPCKDYFIYADDYEYSLRIRAAGMLSLAVNSAKICHDFGARPPYTARCLWFAKTYSFQEPWKIYYDTRNTFVMLQNLQPIERYYAYAWWLYLLLFSTIKDSLCGKKNNVYYRWIGTLHGLSGIMGKLNHD